MLFIRNLMEAVVLPVSNIVIDDLRSFISYPEGVLVYARTSEAGLKVLEKYKPVGVRNLWLDHDLGLLEDGNDDTIMSIVDYLAFLAHEGTPYPVEKIHIHTSNPVGRKNIKLSLDRWGYKNVIVHDASQVFIVEGEQ